MKDINFEQYKVFFYVAKNLSFSHAAKELFISQSAVSQSIKNLEKRLDTELFTRMSKKISLTDEGEILYENAKVAFSYIANGELSIKNINDVAKKEISIAASDTVSKYFLLPYIEEFHRKHPEIKINILNRNTDDSLISLEDSTVDLSVFLHTKNISNPKIRSTKIKEVHDVFIAGPKYSYLKDQKIDLSKIIEFPILALEKSSSTRQNLDNIMSENNANFVPDVEMQSMGLLKDLTRIGLGFSYITELALSKTTDLFVLPVNQKLPVNFISIATLKKNKLDRYTEEFLKLIIS